MPNIKPTPEQLRAAQNGRVPDIIAPGLDVIFCGINPSVYSVVVGHHFARPGNRFWPALFAGGFTERLLKPHEDEELLRCGCGITNVVERATVGAAELANEEYLAGGAQLRARLAEFAPRWLCVLGIGAFRTAFDQPKAIIGLQDEIIGQTRVWVLPNPSGLNAHYHPPQLAQLFSEFRRVVRDEKCTSRFNSSFCST